MQVFYWIKENLPSPPSHGVEYIEDIYFFEVNTKYISSSELKTSEFSRVRSTSENFDVFNSRDEIYLVFTSKKVNFPFILSNFLEKYVIDFPPL